MNRAAMLQEVRMDLKRRWPPRQDALPPENGAILTELQPLTGLYSRWSWRKREQPVFHYRGAGVERWIAEGTGPT